MTTDFAENSEENAETCNLGVCCQKFHLVGERRLDVNVIRLGGWGTNFWVILFF